MIHNFYGLQIGKAWQKKPHSLPINRTEQFLSLLIVIVYVIKQVFSLVLTKAFSVLHTYFSRSHVIS